VLDNDREKPEPQTSEERERLAAALLYESEARFRALADSAPVPIWVNGVDAGCEFVNKAYLEFFGKTLRDVQGFGWQPHAHPEDEERYVGAYLAAFRARQPFRCQARFRDAKGEYRWLDSVGQPRFAPSGAFLGYVGASPDITDTKRVELNSQFINELDLALSRNADPDEIVSIATRKLGGYLGVRGCHLGEIDVAAGQSVVRAKWEGWLRDMHSLAGEYRIDDYVSAPIRDALAAGEASVVENVATDLRTRPFAATYQALGVGSALSVPILHEKQWRATLTVVDGPPRVWRSDEIQLVRDVASRIWLAVAEARSLEALQESERRARRTLADQMLAGVAGVGANGRLTMVNRRYCELTGYDEGELLAMTVADVTHPDDWPRNAELYGRLFETGEGFFFEKRYRRRDGAEIWVNAHTSPIRGASGKVESAVSVVVDVTDRKRVEQQLAAAKDRLAADLTTLQAAYERADAATRAKDEFLSVVSHELRSPLSAILGYTQILILDPGDPARVRQMAEIIERNGRAQVQLIDDLLDTGRIISGKLKLEVRAIDLAGVVARAVEVGRPAARAKGVELRSQVDVAVGDMIGDPDRLEQVVWNLISNAVKFTAQGGHVDVILERHDAEIQIVVRDDGKGMEPEVLTHVFERFWQSDMSSARRAGGLGLGLPLVRHLVELHGGTVVAASAGTDRGSTFTVRLPLQPSYVAPAEETRTALAPSGVGSATLAGLRVLVVDDLEDMRAIMVLMLKAYGADAVAVDSGEAALQLLGRRPPREHFDLLVCDIGMPREDGYDVIRKVRALPGASANIPAIALTAYGRAQDRVRALEAGFQTHLVKPVEPDELVVVVRSLLKRFGALQEQQRKPVE
jgi:PAS domain S-box-containing protein